MRQYLLLFLICVGGWWSPARLSAAAATNQADVQFHQLADEFLDGYLAWRPGLAVALGLHEFDGRVTDYSRVSVNLERARLANFDRRLARFPAKRLSPREAYDFRILRSAVL